MRRGAGFSLIEMLVALAVLALVAAAVLQQGGQSLLTDQRVRYKQEALQIADNAMSELRLRSIEQVPASWQQQLDRDSGKWLVQYELKATALDGLYAMSVVVVHAGQGERLQLDSYRRQTP